MSSTSPLSALRHWLEASHLDGMIVPRADAWQSEYCAPYDEKLAWLTGFDGSAGVALVLKTKRCCSSTGAIRFRPAFRSIRMRLRFTICTMSRWQNGWQKTLRREPALALMRC